MIDVATDARHGHLFALVAHAREVRSEDREAFAVDAEALAQDPRAIVVRTCHRVELYAVDEPVSGHPLDLPPLPAGARRIDGLAAARHLFAVAAGLDSVIVGEDQILHQLRDSLSERHASPSSRVGVESPPDTAADGLHPTIERLFQVALRLGRETRSWREGPTRSLADLALDTVAAGDQPLGRVLVVGAGRMARLAASAAARRGARVVVVNRSRDRAAALAHDVDGEVGAFGPDAALPTADAILVAIGAPWPLSRAARDALLAGTQPVVDLSAPPALDAATRAALGTRYTSIDDLAREPQDRVRVRLRGRFERALDEAEQRFAQWLRARDAVPAIRALTDRAEARRAEELDRLFRRTALADEDRELVIQMSRRLVAGLLHAPLVRLRDDDTGELEQAARSLFSL